MQYLNKITKQITDKRKELIVLTKHLVIIKDLLISLY